MLNINQEIKPLDENGDEHGEWAVYFDNGKLHSRVNYFHGILDGLDELYFYNGDLAWRGYWGMGRRIKFWSFSNQTRYYLCLV